MNDPMDDWSRSHMTSFINMDAAVLLPWLTCLTDHERDIILTRARYENRLDAMTHLMGDVHRRWLQGSYQQLLRALYNCKHLEIAQEMERELVRVHLSAESSREYPSGNCHQTRNVPGLSNPPSSQNAASTHHSLPEIPGDSGAQDVGSVSKQNEGLSTSENVIAANSTGKASPCSVNNCYPFGETEVGMVESPSVASGKNESRKPRSTKSETAARANITHPANVDLQPVLDAPAVETTARNGGDVARNVEEIVEKPGMLRSCDPSLFPSKIHLEISNVTDPGMTERPDPECTVPKPNESRVESSSAEQTCANSQTQDGNDSVDLKQLKIDALQGYQNWKTDDNSCGESNKSFHTAQRESNFSHFGVSSYNDLTLSAKSKEPDKAKLQNIPNKSKTNGEELIRFSTGDVAYKSMDNTAEFYMSVSSPEHKEDYQAQPGAGEGISKIQSTTSLTEDVQSHIPWEGEPVDNRHLLNQNVHNSPSLNLDSISVHTPANENGSWLPYLIATAVICAALVYIKQRYKSS
uniref:uncharacterized protein isoform X1 n=2 Tax=Myxine glutinosa TaxID=7769 RepID=UPI00358F8131